MAALYSVIIKANVPISMVKHISEETLNFCSWATAIHLWLRINFHSPFAMKFTFYINSLKFMPPHSKTEPLTPSVMVFGDEPFGGS